MNIVKTLTVGTFLASTLVAGTAFAKGHDQSLTNGNPFGFDTRPGVKAVEETAERAQTLGEKQGNSRTTPAAENSNGRPSEPPRQSRQSR